MLLTFKHQPIYFLIIVNRPAKRLYDSFEDDGTDGDVDDENEGDTVSRPP
jgi:hypothetical protein